MASICGVDEAGRGALAGPVVAASCIIDDKAIKKVPFLNDSKQLTAQQRRIAYEEIIKHAHSYHISVLSHRVIDRINILQATLKAMAFCITKLTPAPDLILIDGNKAPHLPDYNIKTIIKGDALHPQISAASILAKVTRDNIMITCSKTFLGYGFEKNKGYGTSEHYDQIFSEGPSPIHRRSFNLTRQESLF